MTISTGFGTKTFRVLVLIVAIFCVLGAVHSVAIPLFEAPDEIWHFSFTRILAAERALPVQPTDGKDMWLREAGQPPLYYILSAPFVAPLDTSDFPDFARFNVAHPAVTATSESAAPNVFIHTPRESFPYQGAVLAVHLLRLLTIPWGAATVVGTYLVAREVAPDRPGLGLTAAALTAFNPHFIYISSVVNNDATTACLCTFGLWLAIRLGREIRFFGKTSVSLGIILGLALLSKVSALALLPLVVLALLLIWWRDRDARALLVRGGIIFGLAALIGGWWYIRNWALYGDPLAWNVWLADIGVQPITLLELIRQFGHVGTSYWSPYDGLFPAPVFWGLGLLAMGAIAGWVRMIARRDARTNVDAEGLLLAGAWFVLLFASLISYMTTTPSAEGRLLFPGVAAFSLLLAWGWEAVAPRRWMGAAAAGLLALSIFSPFVIASRYALPLLGSADDVTGATSFGDADFGAVRLLGIEVEPDETQAGGAVDVTLYWETLSPPPADLRAVVRLWTLGGRLVGQRDMTPAGEVYPPDLWRAGDIVRDTYHLPVEESGPAMCRVTVDVLAGEESLGAASSPPLLKLAGPPVATDQIAHPLAYTLGDRVELAGYDLSGEPPTVTLYWRVLAEMDEEYTVFVHLLDEDGALLGQADGPPLNGDYPTSYWSPGELLADTHIAPPGSGVYLLVGLYRPTDGARLPVRAATGERVLDDAIVLDIHK
ncbi:MAG: glycosyltransferase family 39 protein [Chloroflexi bacterium]|nr:glycosyltransferase family 39 protein [Chloroflexota bacterium]